MKKHLLISSFLTTGAFLASLAAFANSNAASKLYVCATAQNSDLDESGFEALDWVEITAVGSRGEMGKTTNILVYPTWDTSVVQKAKGTTDAGSPELEVARLPNDPGQEILRAAAAIGNNNSYAFKELRADGSTSENGTVVYNRGLVTGPKRPGGRNEDFDVEIFMLGFQQEEVVVNPSAGGVAPYVTVIPDISGTEEVGEVLTVTNGTWGGDATITYTRQWYANNIAILGANATTLLLTSAHLGKYITARVTATNDAGNGFSTTVPTGAIAP